MRVRVVKPVTAYWNYSVRQFPADQELDGPVARHLADNAPTGSIEVIEDDREEARRLEAEAAAKAARTIETPDPDPAAGSGRRRPGSRPCCGR